MKATTLSLCMIVRDEEANLADCLRSVEGVVDEIVIVDTGSKDRTIEIARRFGAVIVELPWANDFSLARNHSLDHATKDWVLVLAADERVEPASASRLRAVLGTTRAQGLQMLVRSLLPKDGAALFEEQPQTRLFERRSEHRYEGIVHEQIAPSVTRAGGTIGTTDLVIVHHGYERDLVQGGKSRARRNLALLERQAELTPSDAYVLYNLGCTLKAVGDFPAARRALEAAEANDRGDLDASGWEGLHMRLAQLALASNDHEGAVIRARQTLVLAPTNPVALQILALGLFSAGDVSTAVATFRKLRRATSLSPALAADIDRLLSQLSP
jgi:tetratricopeptide (TPR) repeat protein